MCSVNAGIAAAQMIGTVVRGIGQYNQGRNQAAESKFRSQVAANNATIANNNATIALEKGEADIADQKLRTRQRIGLQRAQIAGAGFDVSGGSSIDILSDTAALGELDVLRIEADAENTADNLRFQASNFQTEADLGRFASKSQKKAGKIKAVSTLITGASRAGGGFLDRKP